ncbi:cytochrome P450 [Paxillus ammoniavirescens]|nr:cytochrome P450 [Paxillus ammoniavirescens]
MELTPGVTYLGRWATSTVLPAIGVFLLLTRILAFAGISLSAAWLCTILAVGFPLSFSLYILSQEDSKRRRAAALGARMFPQTRGHWPGNADVLWDLICRTETAYIGQVFLDHNKLHGPVFNMRMLWEDTIITTEPQHIKTILATDFTNYVKGNKLKAAADNVLGDGVFNSDGETWKLHRTMTRPFFSIDKISHFDIFDRHAETVVGLMKQRFRVGLAIDFQDVTSRFTLDAATEFLLGHCLNTLAAGIPYPYNVPNQEPLSTESNTAQDFAAAFTVAQQRMVRRSVIGQTWPLFELLEDRTRKPMEVVDAFLIPILKDAIEKHKVLQGFQETAEESEDGTLLDHLIQQTMDIKVLKDEILNILLAGRDTTASTLTSAIYLMALHPDVLCRLREEILEKVGLTRRPTYNDIREMKYLRAVLNETLRLFPAVPFNVRESVKDTTWESPNPGEKPFFVPGATALTYSVLLMHRRTDLWGPDASEFDPDRFIDERLHKYLVPNPFIFLPFNAGPRICLGQQFAYSEMSFMLIRLLQSFSSISLSPESQDPSNRPPVAWKNGEGRQAIEQFHPRCHLTLYAKGGMWVKMEPVEV